MVHGIRKKYVTQMRNSEFQSLVDRYGYYSSAALLVKYVQFLDCLQQNWRCGDVRKNVDVMSRYSLLRDHYAEVSTSLLPSIHADHVREVDLGGRSYLQYDREAFIAQRPDGAPLSGCAYRRLDPRSVADAVFYIYSIDRRGEIIINPEPMAVHDMFFRKDGARVTHAHLLEDRDSSPPAPERRYSSRGDPTSSSR
jgi:hypothetical protein